MSREAMQLALEALEKVITAFGPGLTLQQNAITALRQALETEPVCWTVADGWVYANDTSQVGTSKEVNWETLYTTPPKQWVGMTDDDVFELADTNLYDGGKNYGVLAFAKAIEQALKERNQ